MPLLIRSFVFAISVFAIAIAVSAKDASPISTGEYEIRLGGERIGDEQFRLFKKKNRYILEMKRVVYWPEPMRYEYRVELEAEREPKKVELTTTRGGNFTKLKLERKGKNWRLEVDGRGRKKKKHQLGRREGAIVDFDSVLFTALALRRFQLVPGQHKSVTAIVLTLPDLAGARVDQTYTRVEDEEIETEVQGPVRAAVYELATGGKTHRIWVGPSGFVLKGIFDRVGGEREVVLVRLTSERGALGMGN